MSREYCIHMTPIGEHCVECAASAVTFQNQVEEYEKAREAELAALRAQVEELKEQCKRDDEHYAACDFQREKFRGLWATVCSERSTLRAQVEQQAEALRALRGFATDMLEECGWSVETTAKEYGLLDFDGNPTPLLTGEQT